MMTSEVFTRRSVEHLGRVLVTLLLVSGAGCNLLTPLALIMQPPKKTIPAEFDRLEGKRVLVLVWAPQETLIEYPWARLEIAQYVGDKIVASVKPIRLVSPKKVEDHIEQLYESEYDPRKIGETFKADIVVYIELLEYEMRNPNTPQLRLGTIRASVVVHDLAKGAEPSKFELEEVLARYPEKSEIGVLSKSGLEIRKLTYEKFAEYVSRKFHEYEIEIE